MQLDFLATLTGWIEKATRCENRPVLKTPDLDNAALTCRCRDLLFGLGCEWLAERVRVRWNARMRTTAGLAGYAQSLITLNPKIVQFGEAEIDRTLRHELAHLLAHRRAGRRRIAPHGPEWKQACRDLGLSDEKRCHELPLPRRKAIARHTYHCPSCNTDIKRVRPFRRRVACLACCKAHNKGRYHEKFRLVKVPPSGG